jgi:hypothetical protein
MTTERKAVSSLFFRGRAQAKFNYSSSETNEHVDRTFELVSIYDVRITDIKEVSIQIYRDAKSILKPKKTAKKAELIFEGKTYDIELSGLKFCQLPEVVHEQQVENTLMGEFEWIEVLFSVPDKAQIESDIPTSNFKEDPPFVWQEFILNNGQTEWRVIKAPYGTHTGRIQRKNDLYRTEHYHENGKTYWSKWEIRKKIKLPPKIAFGPTGLTRRNNGRNFVQILREDMTFTWVSVKSPPSLNIWATLTVIVVVSIFMLFLFDLSTQQDGKVVKWLILPMAIIMFVVAPLINKIYRTTNNLSKVVLQLNWFIITVSAISFTIFLITEGLQSTIGSYCDNQNFIHKKNQIANSSISTKNDSLFVNYKWVDSMTHYKVNLSTSKWSICNCTSSDINFANTNHYYRYEKLMEVSKKNIRQVKHDFFSTIQPKTGDNTVAKINAVVSFLQSRVYPKGKKNNIINDVLSPGQVLFGVSHDNTVKFESDCDDRTLTAFFLLSDPSDGIDLAIFNFDDGKNKHSMLGISGLKPDNAEYQPVSVGAKKYYLWELTQLQTFGFIGKNYRKGHKDYRPKDQWKRVIWER